MFRLGFCERYVIKTSIAEIKYVLLVAKYNEFILDWSTDLHALLWVAQLFVGRILFLSISLHA